MKSRVSRGKKKPSEKGKSSAGSPGLTKPAFVGGAKARNETPKNTPFTPRADMT